jgi:hypothetical protein
MFTGLQEVFKMILVNFFAGPSSGKSTTAAGVFSLLKLHGVNCEYVPEFAKDLTWENRYKTLENQIYIFAKQQHRIWRLRGEVDVAITDAPLIQGLVYVSEHPALTQLVMEQFNEFDNINFFLDRTKEYNPKGRSQTENEAIELDNKIIHALIVNDIPFMNINGDKDAINVATLAVLKKLGGTVMNYKVIEYQEVD